MLSSSKKINRVFNKNNNIRLHNFDYDLHIKNKKNLRIIKPFCEKIMIFSQNVLLHNDFMCDNLIYFIGNCNNKFYQINNKNKTKYEITNFETYLNLCKLEINIFCIDENDYITYKLENNDILISMNDNINYDRILSYEENTFCVIPECNLNNEINSTIYLSTKLVFYIDDIFIFHRNLFLCLKKCEDVTKTSLFNSLTEILNSSMNIWITLYKYQNNCVPNLCEKIYQLYTKDSLKSDDELFSFFKNKSKNKILNYYLCDNTNIFENNYVLSNVEYKFNYDNSEYDWNVIIPYCNRKDNLIYLLKNFDQNVKPKVKTLITIVELSDVSTFDVLNLEMYCNVNYIWINKMLTGGYFVKCLCGNIGHILSKKYYKYNHILWHDVDCAVQSNFCDEILSSINNITNNGQIDYEYGIMTYPNKTVLHTTKELGNEIRNGFIDVNDINVNYQGLLPIVQGSPGGSIIIKTTLFEKIGMFNTCVTYDKCPEDNLILILVKKYGYLYEVKRNNNDLIHLWHE